MDDQGAKWQSWSAGVDKVTTVEYQEIRSEHPSISTLTPKELAETWLASKLPQFDFAVSFSSYEHDGLGRYGDPIDPWGDIWDVHRITCFVKPDGLLFLGVPMGPDQVWPRSILSAATPLLWDVASHYIVRTTHDDSVPKPCLTRKYCRSCGMLIAYTARTDCRC